MLENCQYTAKYILIISPLLFFTACAGASGALYSAMTDKLDTEISGVKRSGDANSIDSYEDYTSNEGSLLTYEDDLVRLEFPKQNNLHYITLRVENKHSENPIYIDWDKVKFIDADGEMNNILRDGVKSGLKNEFKEDWSNGRTAIEAGDSNVYAFIPFPMYRKDGGGYNPELAFTCVGKVYDFEVTSMALIEGGFSKPNKCSKISAANMTVLQFANYTEPAGKNFSIVLPVELEDNTAKYNVEFFVNGTVK